MQKSQDVLYLLLNKSRSSLSTNTNELLRIAWPTSIIQIVNNTGSNIEPRGVPKVIVAQFNDTLPEEELTPCDVRPVGGTQLSTQ